MKQKKPLKVGFDLDGVLLYNPARIVRLPVSILTRILFKKKGIKFYIPKSEFEKIVWHIFHFSSLFVAPGLDHIETLVKNNKIEAHIITARYSFLEHDLHRWEHKLDKNEIFKSINYNKKDEQPHLFKERMIKSLELDVFIEDNIDIVRHLTNKTSADVYWIYNIVDHFVKYPFKFPHLIHAIKHLESTLAENTKKR